MKRTFIKFMPLVAAAVLLATSCGKDDDSSASVAPSQNPDPVIETVVDNTVKTITITGKIGKESLSKVTVGDENQLAFQVDDEFSFGTEGEGNIYGSIKITDAESRAYTATINFPTGKETDLLATSGFKATKGTEPTAMSDKYANLAKAVAASYYEVPFKVTKDDGKYSLQTTAEGKSGDILVFIQNAFINAQRTGTISFGGEDKSIEINNYYIVPVGAKMGKADGKETAPGKIYTVKKLAGTISFTYATLIKSSLNDAFTNAFTISSAVTAVYSTSNEKVATVDANGEVTLRGVGTATITATSVTDDTYEYGDASYTLTVKGLKNEYTVGTSTKVEFSLGNLQYYVSETPQWRFAPNQWDVCHATDDNVGENYASWSGKWTDLFGWGAWVDGQQALNTSEKNADYFIFDASSATIGKEWRPLTGGGLEENGEWYYLFNSRDDADKKYGWGSVNGVNGIIILPDGWPKDKNPAGCTFTSGMKVSNSYTVGEDGTWTQMEANGAVFLPAAGYRSGTKVSEVGYSGRYWSSSHFNMQVGYLSLFGLDVVRSESLNNLCYGYSVRLVRGSSGAGEYDAEFKSFGHDVWNDDVE